MLLNVEKYKIFEKLWKPGRKMKMKLQPIFMYHKFTNLVRNRKTTIIATSQHYIIIYLSKCVHMAVIKKWWSFWAIFDYPLIIIPI